MSKHKNPSDTPSDSTVIKAAKIIDLIDESINKITIEEFRAVERARRLDLLATNAQRLLEEYRAPSAEDTGQSGTHPRMHLEVDMSGARLSVPQATLQICQSQWLHPIEILDALAQLEPPVVARNISSTLSRMVQTGQMRRDGQGRYKTK